MVAPVMIGDTPTLEIPHTGVVETPPTEPVAEEVIEAITFENVLNLQAGKTYKLKPSSLLELGHGLDAVVTNLSFSSLSEFEPIRLRADLPADTPKVIAWFALNPAPYEQTKTMQPVFGVYGWESFVEEVDEIVIEIKGRTELIEKTSPGGRGRDPFTYHIVNYEAVAIENLTNPDRKFEYE